MENYKKTNYCTQIQVLRDGQIIKSLIFNQDKIIVGRILSVDLVVDDISISRIHAAIDISDKGTIAISDLGSVNGIIINGQKVTDAQILSGGRVKLGDVELIIDLFREEDVEESPEPRAPIVKYYSELEDIFDLKKLAASRTMIVSKPGGESYSIKPGLTGVFPVERPRGSVLEGVLLIKDSILDVKHIEQPKNFYIGVHKTNDFIFGSQFLPDKFRLIKKVDGKYFVSIIEEMRGVIQRAGENVSLERIKKDPSTSFQKGVYTFPMAYRDILRIEIGNAMLMFLFVERSVSIEKKSIIEPDPPFHASLFISFVLHLLLILIIRNAVVPDKAMLERIDDRFVDLLVENKKPDFQNDKIKEQIQMVVARVKHEPKVVKKIEEPKLIEKKEVPAKLNVDKTEIRKEIIPKGPVKIIAEDGTGKGDGFKAEAPKDVKTVGILGALSKGRAGSLSKLFGTTGLGKGSGKNVVAPMGVKGGTSNFGLRDVSEGVGKTFGIGSGNIIGDAGEGAAGVVSASGALKGTGGISLKAFNGLKGTRYTGNASMSETNTVVIGALTKEEIWAVVEKHFSEIQNCYEIALQANKKLAGKVTMNWVIGGDGHVKTVDVYKTTLNNVYTESCMRNRIKYWLFPKPRGGGVVKVMFPFSFNPI